MRTRVRMAFGLAVLLAAAAAVGGLAAAGQGGTRSGGTLQIWLGADLTQATPGQPTRKWFDLQVKRFEAKNPGWGVNISFLSFDNAQTAAKLTAAFSSHNVPDVINHWAGAFNTQYASQLLTLNKYIKKTRGMYQSMPKALWDSECVPNFKCTKKSKIVGVPWNASTYVLFYNKKLLAQAGIKGPPKTYKQLFADCTKLNAAGIIPVSMGANDGYTTSNIWTTNLVSTLAPGNLKKLLTGKMAYDSPKLVAALKPVLELTSPSTHCTSPNAMGENQLQGINEFMAGKAAMAPLWPLQYAAFKKALGAKNLGVAREPLSGHSRLMRVGNGYAGTPSDAWIIPKDAKNAQMAWRFVKIASSAKAQRQMANIIGLPPSNTKAVRSIKDRGLKFIAELAHKPALQELDQVMPNAYALDLYRQLALGQLQKQSAAKTLQALQAYVKANPAG